MAVTIVLLFVSLIYVFLSILYSLLFHPLAKCPGPFLSKISSWPSFYHAWKGDRHIWTWQCFQIYGDKFRTTPDTVLFRSPQAFNDIYNSKANVKKSNFYDSWPRNKKDLNTLSTTDVALHAKKRRLLSLAFTEQSLQAAAGIVAQHVDRWDELLLGGGETGTWSSPRDMSTWSDSLVFDISGDLLFGRTFNAKEPSSSTNPFKAIPSHVAKFMQFIYPITKSPFLDLVIWLKVRGLNSVIEMMAPREVRDYYDFVAESVSQGLATWKTSTEPPVRKNIFQFLCSAIDPETGKPAFSLDDLLSETHLLVIASRDTTAVTLSAILFYVCHDLRVYSKVVQEIRTTFVSADEISIGSALSSCTYLRACIDEALRMSPPGPSELPRVVLRGGTTIEGDYYPEGLIVGTSGWSTGYNEEVFGDATVYRPERWIASDESGVSVEDVSRLKNSFSPFSRGPGSCLGQNLAVMELMMAMGRTLHQMDVQIVPGSNLGEGAANLGWGRQLKNQFQLQDAYLAIREGPMIQCRERQD